jgi:hypothetical protein
MQLDIIPIGGGYISTAAMPNSFPLSALTILRNFVSSVTYGIMTLESGPNTVKNISVTVINCFVATRLYFAMLLSKLVSAHSAWEKRLWALANYDTIP